MKVVYYKCRIGKMLTYSSSICGRKVCTYCLYMFFVIAQTFPETIKGILSIAIIDIDNMTIIQIYNYTRVRDKKRLVKVGNLVKNSYLYR